MKKKAICHRDGTVTYWSVPEQKMKQRVYDISNEELAYLPADERFRVMEHLGYKHWVWTKKELEKYKVKKGEEKENEQ